MVFHERLVLKFPKTFHILCEYIILLINNNYYIKK